MTAARVPPSLNGALTRRMLEPTAAFAFDEKVEWVGKEHSPTPFHLPVHEHA